VTGVEMFRKLLDEGLAGDNVDVLLRSGYKRAHQVQFAREIRQGIPSRATKDRPRSEARLDANGGVGGHVQTSQQCGPVSLVPSWVGADTLSTSDTFRGGQDGPLSYAHRPATKGRLRLVVVQWLSDVCRLVGRRSIERTPKDDVKEVAVSKKARSNGESALEAQFSRFQMEVDTDMAEEMDRLQMLGGLRTRKELVATSITILKWLSREKAFGCDVLSVGEDGAIRELSNPFLDTVAVKARKEGASGQRRSFKIVRERPNQVDKPTDRAESAPSLQERLKKSTA